MIDTLENNLAVPQNCSQSNNMSEIPPLVPATKCSHFQMHIFKRNESIYPHKNVYMDVNSSITHNHQNPKCPTNKWINADGIFHIMEY